MPKGTSDQYNNICPIASDSHYPFARWGDITINRLLVFDLITWNQDWQVTCFVWITVSYILNNCPEIKREVLGNSWLRTVVPKLFFEKIPRENEPKEALLQWYRATCVHKILAMLQPQSLAGRKELDTHLTNSSRRLLN